MASPSPHSKYRKETSKQNSREDNHWSPSKPRSITLKRGGSSYQRNQHKPLSRQLMPGLVLSLSPSFFPSSELQRYNLIPDELTLGGRDDLWRPDSHTQTSILLSLFFLQFLFCGSPNPGTKCVCPTSWSWDATHNAGRWHFLTPEGCPPPPSSPLIQSARPEFF